MEDRDYDVTNLNRIKNLTPRIGEQPNTCIMDNYIKSSSSCIEI